MSNRRSTALKLLAQIWPIHFPPGKAFNDQQFRLLCRDSFVLADLFNQVGDLGQKALHQLGQPVQATGEEPAPAPEPSPAPPSEPEPVPAPEPLPAAESVVEAVQ